jgi:hypothetical protein
VANTVELTLLAHDKASSVVNGVSGAVRSLIGQFMAMAGLTAGAAGLGALIKQGIEFNKTMEDSKGGIAGVLLMARQYVDSGGKVVTGQKAMNAAFSEASVIQEKLKKDALGTAASYTDLVQAFQSSIGPATKAGIEDLDDLREITVMATQAMAALGIPTAQAAQELRGLFAGDMGPDNRLNQVLGITKKDLAAVAGDAEAVAKLFKDRLAPAASVAALQTGTLTVRLSNLGDIVDQTMGEATAGLFKDLSGLIAEVSSGVGENAGMFKDLGDTVRESFAVVKETISDVLGTATASVSAAGLTWRDVFFGLSVFIVGFVESVGAGMKSVTQYLTSPVDTIWGIWKTVIFGIAALFSELLMKLADAPVVGKFFKGWSMGMDDLVVSMTTVDERFARFEKRADANFGDGAFAHARKMMEDYGKETEKATAKLDGLGSQAKKTGDDSAAAAYHFGQVWAAESAKASAALEKFTGGFASFTGDVPGEAVAKIEAEYRDLVGQLGQLMFLAKVPFEKGLAMLEAIAKAKGEKITAAIFNGEAAVEDFIGIFEAKLSRENVSIGIAAGFRAAFDAIPEAAESAASAVQGVWQSMARAFDDSFYSVLSGKLDNLKDVFKNLWDSVLQTFSRYLSDMLQRWIKTQIEMEGAAYTGKAFNSVSYGPDGKATSITGVGTTSGGGLFEGGWGALGPSGGGTGGWKGAAAGAGIGLGVGSIVGQFGSGKYNQVGGSIGGMIGGIVGSIVPGLGTLIGSLIGSVIGLLIGALASSSTEKHVRAAFDGALAAATQKWVFDKKDPEGGHFVTTSGAAAPSQLGQDMRDVFESQATRLFDMFRVGAKDKAAELFADYQKTLRDALSGATVDIAAGSEADIQKDTEIFLQKLLPRLSLSAAFGQTGYLPAFNRDAAGGIPGINWSAPQMDVTRNLFDPDAPIPTMLRDLGVTAERIGELAAKISTEDPEKLLAYIEGLVGVLVEFQRLGTAMGQTVSEVWAGFDKQAGTSPAAGIASTAQDIADLFDVIDTYSGDTQLEKMKEAEGFSSSLWDSVLDYMAKLKTLADQLSAGLQGMRGKMRDFLNPRSEAEGTAADWSNVTGVWGKLLQGKTPGEIEKVANEAAAAIERMFNVMAERVTRGKALIERITTLTGSLWDIGKDVAFDQLEKTNPIAAMGQDLVDIQQKVGAAAHLTGLEQIAAMESTAGSAEEMAGKLRSLFAEIASVSASINKSFDSQIWELGVGELDPKGQASAITQRIHDLQEQLKIATAPSEIQAIASEIQSLTSRYVGTFGQDDAKRQEAIAWAQEQLERARGLAQDSLDLLRSQAEAYAEELRKTMSGSVGMISTNVTDAATVIGQLSFTLGELDRIVREQIERLGTEALDALAPLREAMEGAAGIFTGATGDAATALTAPEVGLTASTDRASARLDVFSGAVDRAVANLDRLANAGGGGAPAPAAKAVQAAPQYRVSAREVVPLLRRYSKALTPRVA